jgi:hypothetical protein
LPQPRQAELVDVEAIQEGSRWIHGRPTGEDFAKWFGDNVKLHDGLEAKKYVSGLTLITGVEKIKVARRASTGSIVNVEEERLVHTPYAKVETRVAYFWDYMALHEEWVGVIEPAPIIGGGEKGLPPGFFRMAIQKSDGRVVNFVCCSMMVRILKAGTVKTTITTKGDPKFGREPVVVTEGVPVAVYPAATKMIATVGKNGYEDPFAIMKAETGAVGRALGMAGMLVIPGSGVATAEDMLEAQGFEPSAGITPELESGGSDAPSEAPATNLRAEIEAMIAQLEEEKPEALEEIRAWAKERRLNLNSLSEPALRGVHRKLTDALAAE